jgi:hypothetical protein
MIDAREPGTQHRGGRRSAIGPKNLSRLAQLSVKIWGAVMLARMFRAGTLAV